MCRLKSKLRGSLSIEAALVLPIFLFAIFSLAYIIKVIYIQEQVQFAINEAANEMAIGTYLLEKGGLLDLQQETYNQATSNIEVTVDAINTVLDTIDGLTEYTTNNAQEQTVVEWSPYNEDDTAISKLNHISKNLRALKDQIQTEVIKVYTGISETMDAIRVLTEDSKQMITSLGVVPGIQVMNNVIGSKIAAHLVNGQITDKDYNDFHIIDGKKGIDYFKSSFCLNDDDLTIVVSYQIEIPFFKGMIKPINMTQAVKVRAYTGNGNFNSQAEKSYGDKEKQDIVYITKNGTKYHTIRSCRYIDVKVKETTYQRVKDHKAICEICAKELDELSNNTIVYSTDASDIFHTSKTCWTISREVISVTESEAKENGYTLCSKCREEESK